LTIEEEILDKGNLTVVGESKLSGVVQMDSNVVILGNLVVEQNATIKGTTFSRGGIETSSMNMSGDLAVGGATVIDSTLEVFQTTRLHDSLSLLAPLLVGADHVFTVDNSGNTHINGKVTIMDTLIATSNKGAFLGDLVARATSVTTLEATGVVTLNDSLEVHGDTELKGDLAVEENTTLSGSLDVSGASTMTALATTGISNSGVLSSNSIENATEVLTNTLEVESSARMQSLDVSESTQFFGQMTVQSADTTLLFGVTPGANSGALGLVSLPGDLKIYSSSTAHSDAPGAPEISLMSSGTMTATGKVTAKNLETTSATTLSSIAGELRVDKKARLLDGLDVEVGGSAALRVRRTNGTIEMHNLVKFENDLTVTGGRSVTMGTSGSNTSLTVHGATEVGSLTVNSTTSLTGTLTAPDGKFTSALSTNGVARAQQGLVVGHGNSSSTAPPSGYTALFDGSTSGMGTSNGIKIKLNQGTGNVSNANEFITFENNNGTVVGRIRGENSSDWGNDGFKVHDRAQKVYAVTTNTLQATHETLWAINQTQFAVSGWVTVATNFIPDSWMVFWPGFDWGDIPSQGWQATIRTSQAKKAWVIAALKIASATASGVSLANWDAALNGEFGSAGGISYSSGNGDYAEYIPRENIKDEFSPRQIVGVKDGHVTLNTSDADHLMVISTAPIVLGNEPSEELLYRYEKVAFLGQVPVDVLGTVESGDYILPSGDNDGFAIALSPDEIEFEQIDQIVGLAWESGSDPYFNTVNVAVGLDQASSAQKIVSLRDQLGRMESELTELTAMVMTNGNISTNPQMSEELVLTGWRPFRKWNGRRNKASKSPLNPGTKTGIPVEYEGNPAIEIAQASTEHSTMLDGMSEAEIVAAVADAREGKVPQEWIDNLNGRELNTIVKTVVKDHVDRAALEAEQRAIDIKDESFEHFAHVLETMTHNAESLEGLEADLSMMMTELGVDESKVDRLSNECIGGIISHELSMESLTEIFHSDEAKEIWALPELSNIRPGTQAEKRFISQVQYQIFDIVNKEFPEITEHMPEVKSRLQDESEKPSWSASDILEKSAFKPGSSPQRDLKMPSVSGAPNGKPRAGLNK
jgi:cytoskeletal protein CcmA (bactofilin family)